MDPIIQKRVDGWLNGKYDEASKNAVRAMSETELIDAFYMDLEFGTGGLRGVMGAGTNRMNTYTVARATQGFANYIRKNVGGKIKVAVACDSRNNSQAFAEVTAAVFSRNGFEVFLFEALRPTPELSFAVRHLGCKAGVVITASHNPKEYNGYKAYWDDGAQVVPPHDKGIIAEVNAIEDMSSIDLSPDKSLIKLIGKDVDEVYYGKILTLSINGELNRKMSDSLKIIYTPIHGTGITLVPEALRRFGFSSVKVLASQEKPDGNFPTVPYPNPEEPAAMKLGLEACKADGADLLLATDPDADRVGLGVKNHKGEYILLNGNQTAAILIYYLLSAWKEAGKIKGNEYIVKTIVTTALLRRIADDFKVETMDVLTGFKYIAEIIRLNEGKKTFIGGGEESYGYLVGTYVRDKDAVISSCMMAEALAWAKSRGLSLFDVLLEIYARYGVYRESLLSITKKGKEGLEEIGRMMEGFKKNPPTSLGGSKVVRVYDYIERVEHDILTGKSKPIDLPKAKVLQFLTEDGTLVTARPSGTEPKIKFYFAVRGEMKDKSGYDRAMDDLAKKIESVRSDLKVG